MNSKLDEMTSCAAIPAIDGMGLGLQPRPARDLKKEKKKRSAVSSLIGEDADETTDSPPEAAPVAEPVAVSDNGDKPKYDPDQTVAVMRGGDIVHPGEVLALEVDREYAEWRVMDNNRVWEPARIVSNEEARKALGYTQKEAKPELETKAKVEVKTPPVLVETKSPMSLRDFWNPGETSQPLTSLTPAPINEDVAHGMVSTMLKASPAEVPAQAHPSVAAGFGESLMRGGILPPPEAIDPGKLTAAVHAYLAS
jgi:hypothetical protein